jgi:5-carboxymethyl-2-hydroxymuconate isomerase
MPHIELKTTPNVERSLDVQKLLAELVAKLASFESVSPAAIKAYHVPIETWVMGKGAARGFAHCTVSVLTGRTVELRGRMADALVAVIREALRAEMQAGEASVSLELREMDAETYRK